MVFFFLNPSSRSHVIIWESKLCFKKTEFVIVVVAEESLWPECTLKDLKPKGREKELKILFSKILSQYNYFWGPVLIFECLRLAILHQMAASQPLLFWAWKTPWADWTRGRKPVDITFIGLCWTHFQCAPACYYPLHFSFLTFSSFLSSVFCQIQVCLSKPPFVTYLTHCDKQAESNPLAQHQQKVVRFQEELSLGKKMFS